MNETSRSLAKLLVGEVDVDVADAQNYVFNRRMGLSKAITMIESRKAEHQRQSNLLLTYLLNHHENRQKRLASFRLGIAGAPGAGKSTFVEAFGRFLLHSDKINQVDQPQTMCRKLAVICIDPSSAITGGSILGDKTRMTDLARHEKVYVRPSPARSVLGGLAAYTEDVVSVCQAAGYDFVFVETVGLGQSEIEVKESVDMLLLIVPPGGGDELQGIKRGIVEMADMIAVTKADGNFLSAAKNTAADYRGALRILPAGTKDKAVEGWERPPVHLVSSHGEVGLEEVWSDICQFRKIMIQSGKLQSKRQEQARYWMWKNMQTLVLEQTKSNLFLRQKADSLARALDEGKTTPRVAASELLDSLVYH